MGIESDGLRPTATPCCVFRASLLSGEAKVYESSETAQGAISEISRFFSETAKFFGPFETGRCLAPNFTGFARAGDPGAARKLLLLQFGFRLDLSKTAATFSVLGDSDPMRGLRKYEV